MIHINFLFLARVWFDPTSYVVMEDAGTVTLTIMTNVLGGPLNGIVLFTTENGTATSKLDVCVSLVQSFIHSLLHVPSSK